MKKLKLITFALIIISISTFNSCSSNDDSKIAIDENSISDSLNFKKIDFGESNISNNVNEKKIEICIVSWDEWGRASRDCRGWGLCDAVWWDCNARISNPIGAYAFPLYFDDLNEKYYVEILLSSPTDIPNEQLTLKIDEEFQLDTKKVLGENLIFNAGSYPFNESLGDFGGIQIYLN